MAATGEGNDGALRAAQSHAARAALLMAEGDRAGAIAAYRAAAAAQPESLFGHLCKARALIVAGDAADIEPWLRRTLKRFPASGAAAGMLGTALAEAGRIAEARRWFEAAVARDPAQLAYWYDIARSQRFGSADSATGAALAAALARPGLTVRQRVALHLARGKYHDDRDDCAAAAADWTQAAAIGNAALPYDHALVAAQVDAAITAFTPEFLAAPSPAANATDLPLLIVGLPRSGTTLVEQMLTNHPAIGGAGELDHWVVACRAFALQPLATDWQALAAAIDSGWLPALRAATGRKAVRAIDKLPMNSHWLGFVHRLYPGARIIHCRRDPRDTALSIMATYFGRSPGFPARLDDLARHIAEHERLMAHWRRVLPATVFHEIDYETLVADPEPVLRSALAFAGVDWDSRCMKPESNRAVIRTASKYQARRAVGSGSVGRWRRYEALLPGLADVGAGNAQ